MSEVSENTEPEKPESEAEETIDFDAIETEGDFGLEEEILMLRDENEKLNDRLLRAMADAENARKRGEKDRREAELYGGNRLARDILPIYDNLDRALEAVDAELREKAQGLIEGIELTQKELLSVFGKHRIEIVKPEFGDKFDPQQHQAMFEAPVPNAPQGTIIQVMNVGFIVGERLLRPAQVGVSSTPASKVVADPE